MSRRLTKTSASNETVKKRGAFVTKRKPEATSMCTIDWTRYVGTQMKWAEILLTRADEIPGYEARALRAKGAEILADVSRLVGRDVRSYL